MIEELHPAARIIHLMFSLAAFAVVYWLMCSITEDRTTSRWFTLSQWALSLSAACSMHLALDHVVGVP